MLRKIKQSIIALSVLLMPAMALSPAVVYAADPVDIGGQLNQGSCLSTTATDCPTDDADTKVNDLIADVLNIFSLVVGVVAVIMIIIGGFRYITSGGNDSSVAGAKNTILYAIIGLVIVALAQFIVRFVLGRVTA